VVVDGGRSPSLAGRKQTRLAAASAQSSVVRAGSLPLLSLPSGGWAGRVGRRPFGWAFNFQIFLSAVLQQETEEEVFFIRLQSEVPQTHLNFFFWNCYVFLVFWGQGSHDPAMDHSSIINCLECGSILRNFPLIRFLDKDHLDHLEGKAFDKQCAMI
jgi:hypothetical protein